MPYAQQQVVSRQYPQAGGGLMAPGAPAMADGGGYGQPQAFGQYPADRPHYTRPPANAYGQPQVFGQYPANTRPPEMPGYGTPQTFGPYPAPGYGTPQASRPHDSYGMDGPGGEYRPPHLTRPPEPTGYGMDGPGGEYLPSPDTPVGGGVPQVSNPYTPADGSNYTLPQQNPGGFQQARGQRWRGLPGTQQAAARRMGGYGMPQASNPYTPADGSNYTLPQQNPGGFQQARGQRWRGLPGTQQAAVRRRGGYGFPQASPGFRAPPTGGRGLLGGR